MDTAIACHERRLELASYEVATVSEACVFVVCACCSKRMIGGAGMMCVCSYTCLQSTY